MCNKCSKIVTSILFTLFKSVISHRYIKFKEILNKTNNKYQNIMRLSKALFLSLIGSGVANCTH